MANDDFTTHDDQLTPDTPEHDSGHPAGENPFYAEVPSDDLVIDTAIVFDEPADSAATDFHAGSDGERVEESPSLQDSSEVEAIPEGQSEAPHDYTVTDFGGAGTSVSLEADQLEQSEDEVAAPAEADTAAFVGEALAEDGVVEEGAPEDAPHDYSVTDFGGAGSPASLEADISTEDDMPSFEAVEGSAGPEDSASPSDEVADGDAQWLAANAEADTSDQPGEGAPLVADFELEADTDLTRPAPVPQDSVSEVLASNASISHSLIEDAAPADLSISADAFAAAAPIAAADDAGPVADFAPAETTAPVADFAPVPEETPTFTNDISASPQIDAPELVPADTPVVEEEPPAVAAPIPVLRPERGDDSTWQEISRRRSLFPPVSESSLEATTPALPAEDAQAAHSANPFGADAVGADTPIVEADAPADSLVEEIVEEAEVHTTTIPVASPESVENYQPGPHSGEIPVDVLSSREKDSDDLSTTAIRRDLFAPTPTVDEDSSASWHQALHASATPLPAGDTPQKLDDAIFEGTTVVPVVPSRVSAHVASLLLTLLLVPVTWYFFADAGARMTLAEGAPIASGQLSLWALAEFAIGIIGLLIVIALAARSSVGAWVSGVLLTVLGLPWLLVPAAMMSLTQGSFDALAKFGVIGQNLAHHLQVSAYSGRLLLLGLAIWGIGIVSHSARRKGRSEEALRAEVERVNPVGAHLTWSGRRRAAKEAARRERPRH